MTKLKMLLTSLAAIVLALGLHACGRDEGPGEQAEEPAEETREMGPAEEPTYEPGPPMEEPGGETEEEIGR